MKKLITWIKGLSNGEAAIYFGLIPTFFIAPSVGWIWKSDFSLIERTSMIGLILLVLIVFVIFVYVRIRQRDKKDSYDIFIHYPPNQGVWAEALAKNLQQQQCQIFFDQWDISAGQNADKVINTVMQSSRFAVLISTPDAIRSGWVKQSLLKQQQTNPELRCIPIILGDCADSALFENTKVVDFKQGEKEDYAKAFQCLLSALNNQAPGINPYFSGALEIPAYISEQQQALQQQELSFLEDIFSCLDRGNAVMVLRQADSDSCHYSAALLKQAQQNFGKENCLTLFPPNSADSSTAEYFSRLSQQCGFSELKQSAWQWADALSQHLQQQEQPLFVLMTGFEKGSDTAREDLAGELRTLVDNFPYQLKLVIFGAEKLAAMKYQNGALSLLNHLEEQRLPEFSQYDLQHLFGQHYKDLSHQSLEELFHFTGQHPKLVHACLQNKAYTADECEHYLRHSALPSQLFSPFQANHQAQLCHYLQQQEIAHYSVWPQDKLVRKLYWHNLIKQSKNKFIWRSDFIQTMGQQMLECEQG